MQSRFFLAASLALAFALPSQAQNINVDVGAGSGTPSAAYGAGAGQPGTWSSVTSLTLGTPQALVDVSGAPVAATLTLVSGVQFDGIFDNAGTTGDDGALMDDYEDGGTSPIWMFSGLAAGTYSVYTYAWAPDSAAFIDQVSCGTIDPPQNCGGAWPGAQTLGITYTKHHVVVPAGGSITISFAIVATYTTINGFQLHLEGTPSTAFCTGDAVGTTCLGCGNNGTAGRGCANSSFAAGTLLASSGNASIASDTLVLTASDMPGPGLFFQANGLAASPITFGDGMLCAATGIIRMGVVFPTAGVAAYPGGLTPNPIHVAGAPVNAGDTKHYQCWYRDAVAFCTAATYNTSNGVTLTWGP